MLCVNRDELGDWLVVYERAWRTPGTEALAELFAPDATYKTAPYDRPCDGLTQISGLWETEREGHDEVFTMASEIVAVEGDTGVVQVQVRYGDPVEDEYRNLWIVRFDKAGRCAAFEEWPFRAGRAGALLRFLDHLAFDVADLAASRRFYTAVLAPWGMHEVTVGGAFGYGPEGNEDLWIAQGEPGPPLHIALAAPNRSTVNAFHAAALIARGRDNGAPGLRPRYHPAYYAAYALDPDGNNIETVFHGGHPQGF